MRSRCKDAYSEVQERLLIEDSFCFQWMCVKVILMRERGFECLYVKAVIGEGARSFTVPYVKQGRNGESATATKELCLRSQRRKEVPAWF